MTKKKVLVSRTVSPMAKTQTLREELNLLPFRAVLESRMKIKRT